MCAVSAHRIITAGARHVPEIMLRWRELMAAHAALNPELYRLRPDAPALYRAHVERHLGLVQSLVLVALDESGGVRGYLLGGRGKRASIYAVRAVGMIWDMAVRPEDRRSGVGRALVAEALARFEAQGLASVQVTYAPGNGSAAPFWAGLGFETLLREAYLAI
jgi:ribosomal protein S18 acetylase RimI-like enzyme